MSRAGHLRAVAVDDAEVAQHDGPVDLRQLALAAPLLHQLLSSALPHHLVELVPRPQAVLVLEGWALLSRGAGDEHICLVNGGGWWSVQGPVALDTLAQPHAPRDEALRSQVCKDRRALSPALRAALHC